MSLAVLADHMASKGRGPDTMLVHMAPSEVQGLQALAMKHGGSLTINPDTGLPEAGFLDKLLPTIIGAGISFFSGGTIDPMTAAAMVGGVETARTGDLGRGISAGLGAYGGANLTAGMSTTGSGVMANEAGALAGAEAAAYGTDLGMIYPSSFTPEAIDVLKRQAIDEGAMQQGMSEITGKTTTGELLSKGAGAAAKDPMAYLKANAKPLMYAAGPAILAGMSAKSNMPQTVTQQGQVLNYGYDPVSGTFTSAGGYNVPVKKAADGGLMGMNDGGYAPGQLNFAQSSEPVMRMASGGIAGYADGGFTQDQINAALAAELGARGGTSQADLTSYAKSKYGLTDAQINAAYDTIPGFNAQGKYDAADYMATSKPGQVSPQMVVDAAAAANPYSAQNMAKVDVTRPGQYVQDASGNYVALSANSPGFNANNPTALTYLGELASKGGQDSTSQAFNQIATAEQKAKANSLWAAEFARLQEIDRAAGRLPALGTNADVNKGLAGLNQNLLTDTSKPPANESQADRDKRLFAAAGGDWNKAAALRTAEDAALVANPDYWTDKKGLAALDPGASDTTKWFAARGLGFDPIDKVIDNFLLKYKPQLDALLPKDQEAVMRAALAKEKLNEADVIKATGLTIAQLVAPKRNDGSVIVAGDLKDVPVGSLPGGVSGAGDTVVNANGTITTRPDTSLTTKEVRDAYTKGGGSLGYTSPSFDTIEDFEAKYGFKKPSGSKQSYDYLMGKEDYSPIPYTKTGEIMKPYSSSVLGVPTNVSKQMYLFDPATKQYKINPDYAIPTYDKDGKKSSNLTNADVKTFMDKSPSTDAFYTWATTNNLTPEQIAQASGRPINEISKLFTGAKELTNEEGKIDQTKVDEKTAKDIETNWDEAAYLAAHPDVKAELTTGKSVTGKPVQFTSGYEHWLKYGKDAKWEPTVKKAGGGLAALTMARGGTTHMPFFSKSTGKFTSRAPQVYADGGMAAGGQFDLGSYSDGGRLLKGPGDGVSDSIPATIGNKRPARLADGEFVVPARIVSELGNGSTEAGARKLYAMMDRVQAARKGSIGKGKVANNSRADKYLPA